MQPPVWKCRNPGAKGNGRSCSTSQRSTIRNIDRAVDWPPGAFMSPKSRSDAPIPPRGHYSISRSVHPARRDFLEWIIFRRCRLRRRRCRSMPPRRRQVLANSLAAFAWIDASLLSTASVKIPDAAVRQPTHVPALRACGALPTRGRGNGCRSHRAAVLPRSDRA